MNQCTFIGRLTRDPEVTYSSEKEMTIARFTLAVDRGNRKEEGETNADFFRCVAFGNRAQFVEQYLHSGLRIAVNGKLRNENYTNKEGAKVYSVSLLTDNIEFADGKKDQAQNTGQGQGAAPGNSAKAAANPAPKQPAGGRTSSASRPAAGRTASQRPPAGRAAASRPAPARTPAARAPKGDGFMNIPDGIEDEGLPFN